MSASNPLMPQGSLNEPKPRNKSNVYIAVFAILAFHVVLLGALLLQGCKDKATTNLASNNTDTNLLAIPTNPAPNDIVMPNPFDTPPSNTVNVSVPGPAPVPGAGPAFGNVGNVVPMDNNPPPPAAVAQEHVVAAGESFTTIGKKYGVTADAIAKANPGVDSRKLKINQKLKVPERAAAVAGTTTTPPADVAPATAAKMVTYQVKQGDTLIKIAKNHRTTVEKLKAANNLKTTNIRIDQKLKVPTKVEAAAPVATPPPTSTGYVTPLPGRTTASL